MRMAEDALPLQSSQKSCGQDRGGWAAPLDAPGSTSEQQGQTTVFREQLQQMTRKQYLKTWLLGRENFFSTSNGHI
jgi:hypothetical protein